ncbi:hypothetical protein [Citreimonas salinaria]|uniref:Homeodomain-like domain-containing protein n=1 Tax=Citreimonas salinaria TaxID=321339 RepID=A0A1H3KTB3_9RHOB|nr:hypothetical protein [Citreimonas salinaria]SDY54915.1 hypothetical protein SAMN05444340_11073 [Citreimonas salinaria]
MAHTNAEILRLARERVRPIEIAEQLDVSPDTVYSCITTARRRGEDIPRFVGGPRPGTTRTLCQTRIKLTPFMRVCFEKPAVRRGLSIADLAERLLDQLAEEPSLIDAVLDDSPAAPPATVTEPTNTGEH